MRFWNYRGEQNNITDALQLRFSGNTTVCITGSGGKTSLVFSWARELAAAGKRTAVTTTTHMSDPALIDDEGSGEYEGITVIYADPGEIQPDSSLLTHIDSALNSNEIVMLVSRDPDRPGKVMAPPEWAAGHLRDTADAVLIEADGSRRMPLKWPAPWEPVVPDYTDITVCVAGLSSLGKPLSDVMYRCEHLPEAYFRDAADEQLISAVLASADGGQKGAAGEFRVFLNQADTDEARAAAARIQQRLAVCGIQSAWGQLK